MTDSLEPDKLSVLLEFTKKSDLVRYSKTLTITGQELSEFILKTEMSPVGYQHAIHHREILPDQLRITAEDIAAMANSASETGVVQDDGISTLNKINQTFKDRRLLVGHMFWDPKSGRWHFIYFDQRDYRPEDNHWRHGAHVHFLNDLWPEYALEELQEQFAQGNPKLRGSVHIRFEDDIGRDA